ncbi:MAG: hypothetical protein ACP5IT_08055, partial [Thermoproteota archaeon]
SLLLSGRGTPWLNLKRELKGVENRKSLLLSGRGTPWLNLKRELMLMLKTLAKLQKVESQKRIEGSSVLCWEFLKKN